MRLGLTEELETLQDTDPATLSDTELHAGVIELHRLTNLVASARARMTAAWDARKIWADNGSKSPSARLSADCNMAPATARREVRRARRLRTMPMTAAGLADATLSVDQVDELVAANRPEVAHLFERDEAMLVNQSVRLRFWEFHKAVTYWRHCADDQIGKPDPAQRQHHERHFSATVGFDGGTDLFGRLDPLDGAVVRTELERIEQLLFEQDWAEARVQHGEHALPEHPARTAEQRRADAVVIMARRSAAMPADATWTRPLITVLVGYETFAGRICELADGTVVSPGTIVPFLTEADIERVVFDGPSRVIDVGEKRRFFQGATRRAIEVRDRYCTHPAGCDVPSHRCQMDHIEPWAQGGLTVRDNGRALCGFHNRQRNNHNQRPPPESE